MLDPPGDRAYLLNMPTPTPTASVPELEPHCGSWIVVSRDSGTPVFETFTRSVAERVNQTKYEVLTAAQWLGRLNTRGELGGST